MIEDAHIAQERLQLRAEKHRNLMHSVWELDALFQHMNNSPK